MPPKKQPKLKGEKVTLTQVSKLCGCQWRTVKKRVDTAQIEPIHKDKKSEYYDSFLVLPAVLNPTGNEDPASDGKVYNLAHEKAREAAMKADNLQIDRDRKLETVLPKEEVHRTWVNIIAATKSKIRAFPYKILPKIRDIKDKHEQLEEMKKGTNDLLEDLSSSIDPREMAKLNKLMFQESSK